MEAGGVQPLIDQLAHGRICIQAQAAGAIAKLAYRNDETQAAIIECGPGKVLAGMAKRIAPELEAASVYDPATLADVRQSLAG